MNDENMDSINHYRLKTNQSELPTPVVESGNDFQGGGSDKEECEILNVSMQGGDRAEESARSGNEVVYGDDDSADDETLDAVPVASKEADVDPAPLAADVVKDVDPIEAGGKEDATKAIDLCDQPSEEPIKVIPAKSHKFSLMPKPTPTQQPRSSISMRADLLNRSPSSDEDKEEEEEVNENPVLIDSADKNYKKKNLGSDSDMSLVDMEIRTGLHEACSMSIIISIVLCFTSPYYSPYYSSYYSPFFRSILIISTLNTIQAK